MGLTRPALVAFAVAATAASAPAGRPMTIRDLITAVRVMDPQLSPDGRTVAFVRTITDAASGKRNADIWTVASDGSTAPRELIVGDASDHTPRWSPDGRRLAFLSTREGGEAQVFIANADGSGIRKVSTISGGAQPPLAWSPDGNNLAFVADVFVDCRDDACNARRRADIDTDPVKVHRLTALLYRHWDEWRGDLRHHIFVTPETGGAARDLTPGEFDSPPTQAEDKALAFSPDSRRVAFVSNREPRNQQASGTNLDVWLVPVSGGDARKVTANNPAADAQPVFTRDGQSLIVRSQRRAGFESDRWYLDVYDLASGAHRTVFESPDLTVTDFTLSRDGRTILFTTPDHAADNEYRVPLAGGRPELVAQGGSISAASDGGDFLVFSRSTLTAPAELFRIPASGGDQKALTHENDTWVKDVAGPAPESLTVKGGDVTVQYWVLKPPNFDPSRKYPVVFMLHGGPQGEWGDAWSYRWNPALWAAQGWVVAAPNPRGSFGFGQTFVDQVSQDWCGKPMDDLKAVFDAVLAQPYADPARAAIAGASYGGYAVDWLITHTDRFKAAVTHDGVFNLESMALATEEQWFTDWEFGGAPWTARARANFARCSPHLFVENLKTPTLVVTNELDYRVPVDQGLQLFTALQRHNIPSEGLVFPDEGHWVLKARNSERWHEAVFAWLKRYLGD
jgi:dipeptidyl aminopeptidase/acylaminoacyl peptidase